MTQEPDSDGGQDGIVRRRSVLKALGAGAMVGGAMGTVSAEVTSKDDIRFESCRRVSVIKPVETGGNRPKNNQDKGKVRVVDESGNKQNRKFRNLESDSTFPEVRYIYRNNGNALIVADDGWVIKFVEITQDGNTFRKYNPHFTDCQNRSPTITWNSCGNAVVTDVRGLRSMRAVRTELDGSGEVEEVFSRVERDKSASGINYNYDSSSDEGTFTVDTNLKLKTLKLRVSGNNWIVEDNPNNCSFSVGNITLTSICVDPEDDLGKLRVTNDNPVGVKLDWDVYKTNYSGSVMVDGNSQEHFIVPSSDGTVRLFYDGQEIEVKAQNNKECDLGDPNETGITVDTGCGTEGDEVLDTGDEKWDAVAHFDDNSEHSDGEVGIEVDGHGSEFGGCAWKEGKWSPFELSYNGDDKAMISIDNVDDGDGTEDEDFTASGNELHPDGDQVAITVQARPNGETCVRNVKLNGTTLLSGEFCATDGDVCHILVSNAPTDESWTLTGEMSFKDFGDNPGGENPRVRWDVA